MYLFSSIDAQLDFDAHLTACRWLFLLRAKSNGQLRTRKLDSRVRSRVASLMRLLRGFNTRESKTCFFSFLICWMENMDIGYFLGFFFLWLHLVLAWQRDGWKRKKCNLEYPLSQKFGNIGRKCVTCVVQSTSFLFHNGITDDHGTRAAGFFPITWAVMSFSF